MLSLRLRVFSPGVAASSDSPKTSAKDEVGAFIAACHYVAL